MENAKLPQDVQNAKSECMDALERFYVIRPFLEDGVPLAHIAREQAIARRTLTRWVQQYRTRGLAGLTRKVRADKGARRNIPPDLQLLIEGLALEKPRRSTASIHRRISRVTREQGWPTPSYSQVSAIIDALDPGLVVLAHEGSKVYREHFDLLYRFEAQAPNHLWQADHTLLPIWLLNDQGKAARPWLSAILDDHSRAIAGYFLGFAAPCALQTALVLRQAIWRKDDPRWHVCGIPLVFYTDHGSDFTSRHLEQVAADLKIELIFSEVGFPRGRGKIERFFQTVEQRLLPDLPGYAPEGQPVPQAVWDLPAFEEVFRLWLFEEYLMRVQKDLGVTPQVRWEASGFLPRMPSDLSQLDLLLLQVAKTRRVHQDGIYFEGKRYLDLTLAAYIGEDVTIRYDPRDMAEIRVFYHDAFLCRAVCAELSGQTIRTHHDASGHQGGAPTRIGDVPQCAVHAAGDLHRSRDGTRDRGTASSPAVCGRGCHPCSPVDGQNDGFRDSHSRQFHSLATEEVRFILEHKWQQTGVRLKPDDFSDMEAVATVIRITGGNFRLIHRLCTQIERILQINDLHMVTKEVVETAREQLVIGQV